MFIHKTTKKVGNKTHHSFLLSESYRENGKVKHRTIANLSRMPKPLIDAVALTLKGGSVKSLQDLPRKSGKNFGGLFILSEIAKKLFINKILGSTRKGSLAMLLVLGRILTQGSRRHLTFWRQGQATQEVLGLKAFNEDDLYETLDWLEKNQSKMEKQWFNLRFKNQKVELFLYDVTSSYLEGSCNELAAYGYNRDGKKGKKQIVMGLLTSKDGVPIAVEVFEGNTSDVMTVSNQIKKLAERFGLSNVTFVGDRGMLKKLPIESLLKKGWHYITAITKPQILGLIRKDVFQMELFEEELAEVSHENARYILRKNPERAEELGKSRKEKIKVIEAFCEKLNGKLKKQSKSSSEVALKNFRNKITQLKLASVITAELKGRELSYLLDEEALKKASELDGCYVIKTDLAKEKMNAQELHASYKSLSQVEWAFRSMKTGLLEIRPLYHRKATRTRGCAFVAMLAYAISQYLWQKTSCLKLPLDSILAEMDHIQVQEIKVANRWMPTLPTQFRENQENILKALEIKFPKTLRCAA